MKLFDICNQLNLNAPNADIDVFGVASNSSKVQNGFIFVSTDGNEQYISDALNKGAVAVICQRTDIEIASVPIILTQNIGQTLVDLCKIFYAPLPDDLVAVTGTNGKTSTVCFVRQILKLLGKAAGTMGTLGTQSDTYEYYSGMTTMDTVQIYRDLFELKKNGINYVAMEASSHGLHQNRLSGLTFKASAFTNLTRDHLDYHETMENYLQAKIKLFTDMTSDVAVLNADINEFDTIKKACLDKNLRIISYGTKADDLKLISQDLHENGQTLVVDVGGKQISLDLALTGNFQGFNVLAATGLVMGLGFDAKDILNVLPYLKNPDGRMELVAKTKKGASIFVDYAHTPDGLETALKSLRHHTKNRLVVVFGCGGNRDKGKRPMMGRIAQNLADIVVVTDDNPRFENPDEIRNEIMVACPNAANIPNRARAIHYAVDLLEKGDVLLLAGKGHEQGQIIGGITHPFEDKMQARLAVSMCENLPIWTSEELSKATSGKAYRTFVGYGVSIDSRTVKAGDIFVAIIGENTDGHDYVKDALAKGAVAAVVSRDIPDIPDSSKLFFVTNTGEALEDMARYARANSNAKIIGITGSSGKTSTKEMLKFALRNQGVVHATEGNLNNQWGVPLTLANMPPLTDFAIIEMGMNHTGEMTYLSYLVQPDVVMITMIGAAHHEFFPTMQDIASAKAEIFSHMNLNGVVVLNADDNFCDFLKQAAKQKGIEKFILFGKNPNAQVQIISSDLQNGQTKAALSVFGDTKELLLNLAGLHFIQNACGVLSVVKALGQNIDAAISSLADLQPISGRGKTKKVFIGGNEITFIDDAYNANPASMRASLNVLGHYTGRKIAVLGQMLELGEKSKDLHTSLADDINQNKIDKVYCVGQEMKYLYDCLSAEQKGAYVDSAPDLADILKNDLQNGDIVLFKGSHSVRLDKLLNAFDK